MARLPDAVTRILVLEGDPVVTQAVLAVLESAGHLVTPIAGARAALQAAADADLLIAAQDAIDLAEVRRTLRTRPDTRELPMVTLIGPDPGAARLQVDAGSDYELPYPIEARTLLTLVRALTLGQRREEERRGAEACFAALFKLAPVAAAVLDGALLFRHVNAPFTALTGYSAEEVQGQSAAAWLHLAPNAPELLTGQSALRHKNGATLRLEWQLATEPRSNTRIVVLCDLAEPRQGDAEREKLLARERTARADAERSNRMKEEFLATLSHELRNPLNAILGWATLLGRTPDLPPAVARAVLAIERNSRLQAQMIADLLDYAGITFGKLRMVSTSIDPYPVVQAALDVALAAAQSAQVTLDAQFDPAAPVVEADPARLQQVILNLLTNAIKFSQRGGTVEVVARVQDGEFELIVRDHGAGIAAEFLPRIFERFSQQDASSTRAHGGLGLGLAIVKQLVSLQGGTITAHSAGPGTGATFTMRLPLSENQLGLSMSDSQMFRSSDLDGVVALVVEDDLDARDLTKRILTDAGASVIEAASADAALRSISNSGANILISDIGMAGTDGYQLMRTLRAGGYGADILPALALTAFARMQDRNDSLAAGFQEHLVKPIDAQLLVARVGALRRRAARARP